MNVSDAADVNRFLYCGAQDDPDMTAKLKKEMLACLKKEKDSAVHWNILGHIYYIEEDYAAAAGCFRKCALLDGDNEHYLVMLSFAHRHEGDYSRSERIHMNLLKRRNPGLIVKG